MYGLCSILNNQIQNIMQVKINVHEYKLSKEEKDQPLIEFISFLCMMVNRITLFTFGEVVFVHQINNKT